jgi:hypothetical protein
VIAAACSGPAPAPPLVGTTPPTPPAPPPAIAPPTASVAAPEPAQPPKPAHCPADMAFVEGEYCTEVEHKCLVEWFAPQNIGKRVPMRY